MSTHKHAPLRSVPSPPKPPSATKGASSSTSPSSSNIVRNSLIAGSFAGMASTIICYPFDVLRIKMQSTAIASTSGSVAATFRNTLQYGGIRALYTGMALPLGAQAIYKGTIFSSNNFTQHLLAEWRTQENYKLGNFSPYKLSMLDRFICGCMSGAVNAALFVTPVEYVRNKQISQQGAGSQRFSGPISVIRGTLKTDGLSGLWRGMATTVLRDSVGCGFFFVSMAYAQKKLSPDGPPSQTAVTASGAIAGVAFWLWALPLDTMKTWIQAGTARNISHALELSQRKGMAKSIPSLFRGWQVAYGRGGPSAAITVTTYSFVYGLLSQGE